MTTQYCYYDQPALRRSFRSIQNVSPLQEAVLEWYAELSPEEQDCFEKMIIAIIQTMKARQAVCNHANLAFGPSQALELAGSLIAVEMGWKEPPPHRSRE